MEKAAKKTTTSQKSSIFFALHVEQILPTTSYSQFLKNM